MLESLSEFFLLSGAISTAHFRNELSLSLSWRTYLSPYHVFFFFFCEGRRTGKRMILAERCGFYSIPYFVTQGILFHGNSSKTATTVQILISYKETIPLALTHTFVSTVWCPGSTETWASKTECLRVLE